MFPLKDQRRDVATRKRQMKNKIKDDDAKMFEGWEISLMGDETTAASTCGHAF
jgi:hypothetical protein